jgi:glutaredoxin 2
MQISKFELYGSLLFVDKKAYKKENNAKTMSECLALIISKASFRGITINNRQKLEIQKTIQVFIAKIQSKLASFSGDYDRFEKKERDWLNKILPTIVQEQALRGRPPGSNKEWDEKCNRAKNLELHDLIENNGLEKLNAAAALKAFHEKNSELRWVLNELVSDSSKASSLKFAYLSNSNRQITKLSNDEALVLFITADLTKHSYQVIRTAAKKMNADIFPTYDSLRGAKKHSYPKNIYVEETKAVVNLQDLLNHSTQRILEIKEVVNNVKHLLSTVNGFSKSCNNFSGELKLKWGFDGATGQSEYKQKYSNAEECPEKNLFSTTMVPLGAYLNFLIN